jgi:hypothetical protein
MLLGCYNPRMELVQVDIDKATARQMSRDGWLFDWSISSSAISLKVAYQSGDTVQGLIEFERVPSSMYDFVYLIETAPWNQGKDRFLEDVAGTLFAYVAKDSLSAGFEGFVVFDSKTVLVDHYVNKYGAKVVAGNRMVFDTAASIRLIREYLGVEI